MYHHLRITHRDPQRRSADTLALDKDEDWIAEQVIRPRASGRPMFVGGRVVEWDDVDEIHITETEMPSAELLPVIRTRRAAQRGRTAISDAWYVTREGHDVTDKFISGPPGQAATANGSISAVQDPTSVMVVHGQDQLATRALFDWLRSIGLRPREWSELVKQTQSGSPFIGAVLERAFQEAQAFVVLFTPDEHVSLRAELSDGTPVTRLQARPNVLLEAGMALATHPDRTVLAVLGHQELPSDLAGRHYVCIAGPESLRDLARRLQTAGCPVDLEGSDWLDSSRFPDRDGIVKRPAGDATQTGEDAERRLANAELLSAHAALLDAYSGTAVYESSIRQARQRFAEAQSMVLVGGTTDARSAAARLGEAWTPRINGLYMGSGDWRDAVEAARADFTAAAAPDS